VIEAPSLVNLITCTDDRGPLWKGFYESLGWTPGQPGAAVFSDRLLPVDVVIGYAAVTKALAASKVLTSAIDLGVFEPGFQRDVMQRVAQMMIGTDDDTQTRMRGPVRGDFSRRSMEPLRGRIREIAHELLETLEERARRGETVDLVANYTRSLPVRVIMEVLELPEKDFEILLEVSDSIGPVATSPFGSDPELAKKAVDDLDRLHQLYLGYKQKWGPGSVGAHLLSSSTTDEQKFANFVLLLIAGHETTNRLIASTAFFLMKDPHQRQKLQDHPNLMKSAIKEGLRRSSPFQGVGRLALADFDTGAGVIKAGRSAFLLCAAGNMDETVYPDPEKFDVERFFGPDEPPTHLGFGYGIHRCLGAFLAQIEGEEAIRALLTKFPDLEFANGTQPVWGGNSIFFYGPQTLPVTLGRAVNLDEAFPRAMVRIDDVSNGSRAMGLDGHVFEPRT
jgi:cytochrome P450